jgi:DNA polymerase-3 subunit alpha
MQFISEYVAVKRGDKAVEYIFPELEPILKVTNGVITYQEHIMSIAKEIGGYTMGGAANLMKLMSKKKYDKVEHEKPIFMEGAIKKGFEEDKLNVLWEKLLLFANYGFNKAHSASYATVSYWTAYLKAHYPLEFMAALLEGDLDNFDRVIIDLNECERLGIDVLPPSINESGYYFKVEGDHSIRFGLGGIKNVGEDIVKSIVENKKEKGPFLHLDDFVHRMYESVAKRAMEYLIMAGTMDAFGDRNALLQIVPNIYDREKARNKSQILGQFDIFSLSEGAEEKKEEVIPMTPLPNIEKTPIAQVLLWEKELLGLYFSSHPLDSLQEFFESKNVIPLKEAIETKKNNDLVVLGAMVNKVRKISTKKGDMMAFLTLEDKSGTVDAIVFPRTYQELKDTLVENKPILIAGRINVKDGDKSIIVEKAKYVDETKCCSEFTGITFRIRPIHTEEEIAALKSFIAQSEGEFPVKIIVDDGTKKKHVLLKKTIAMSDETKKWLRKF